MSFPFQHQIGVGVVLLDSVVGEKVLVGKRKNCAGAGLLSLPGGHLERNESVYDCAVRELEEECGISPENVSDVYTPDRMCFEDAIDGEVFLTVYVVLTPSVGEPLLGVSNREPDKCEGWEWKPIKELFKTEMFCDSQKVLKTLKKRRII